MMARRSAGDRPGFRSTSMPRLRKMSTAAGESLSLIRTLGMGRVFLPEKKVHAQGTQDAAEFGDSVSWCVGGLVAWWPGDERLLLWYSDPDVRYQRSCCYYCHPR